jgi:hypothetical protein
MDSENYAKIYSTEIKRVSSFLGGQGDEKKGGPKMKVSSIMLLKTNVEKMSVCGLAKMLLKTHNL